MNEIKVRAYAKLNLTLDILGRRADGYHDLATVMQSVSLHDTLKAERTVNPGVAVYTSRPDVPSNEKSLIRRAANAFFARTGISDGVRLMLESRIPMQAGLGGGSADAAAALTALNRLFGAGLSAAQLAELGLTLGADVPFCLVGGTQLAEGVGERLHPLPPLPDCYLVLLKPEAGAATAEQYARADALPCLPHPSARRMEQALAHGELREIAGSLGNSFEAVIGLRCVAQCREFLCAHSALGACMTGSGSTVFGLFNDERAAREAAAQAMTALPGAQVFVSRPVGAGCAVAEEQ